MQTQRPSPRVLSCTACRRRKTKCERTNDQSGNPCRTCIAWDLVCDTPLPKKRGLSGKTMSDLQSSSTRPTQTSTDIDLMEPSVDTTASTAGADLMFGDDFDLEFGQAMDTESFAPMIDFAAAVDAAQPSLSYTSFAVTSPNSADVAPTSGGLDTVMSRERVVYLAAMFFEFVWPLQPILHDSSFLSRLDAQDDKTDPSFLALVASVLAVSLVHVPKDFMCYENREDIADKADQCYRLSRSTSIHLYDPPTVTLVTVRYLDAVYNFMTGKKGAWVASLAESTRLAIFLQLHQESSYKFMTFIESQTRRRLFYTLLNSDTSAACMQNQAFALSMADIDVALPQDLDDYITPIERQLPSENITSKLVGFTTSCSLFGMIRETILMRRQLDQNASSSRLLDTLGQLQGIHDRLDALFRSINPVLKIDKSPPLPLTLESGTSDPDYLPILRFTPLIDNEPSGPSADTYTRQDDIVHQVTRANVHTTRAIARMILIHCREQVKSLSGKPGEIRRKGVETTLKNSSLGRDSMQANMSDLLHALRCVPIQAISANSHSLVNKIRSVVVTLLEDENLADPANQPPTAALSESPESMLYAFLALLTRIESFCPVVPSAV